MENKPKFEIDKAGTRWWRLNGLFHREDGPAAEYTDGTKRWYINGKLHREDGPAIEYRNGDTEWFINGKLHRLDGPAIIWADGVKEWCVNDIEITEEITKWAKELSIDIDNLSEVDIALIKIVWADYGK